MIEVTPTCEPLPIAHTLVRVCRVSQLFELALLEKLITPRDEQNEGNKPSAYALGVATPATVGCLAARRRRSSRSIC